MNKFWKIHSNHCPGAKTRSQKNHWKSNINNLWLTQVFGCPWKSPHFQKAPLFTAWCCALMSTWLLTVHWASLTVSLSADWCLLTLVPAQTQPAGPAPQYYWPSHTTRNINTSQSDKKKLEKNSSSFHPLGPSDPIITFEMSKLFDLSRHAKFMWILAKYMSYTHWLSYRHTPWLDRGPVHK